MRNDGDRSLDGQSLSPIAELPSLIPALTETRKGANLALIDGADLGLAFVAHPDDPEKAIAQYEAKMFARSTEAAATSAQGLAMCLAPDAPKPLLDFFRSHGPGAETSADTQPKAQ